MDRDEKRWPRGRVLGSVDVVNGTMSLEASTDYEDDGPILEALRRLIERIESDPLPGDVENISIDRFEFAQVNGGQPIYRFDVGIKWRIDAGDMPPELRRAWAEMGVGNGE